MIVRQTLLIILFSITLNSFSQKSDVEKFKPFYERFYSDSLFQFDRIIFPLKGSEVGGADYIPSDLDSNLYDYGPERTHWKKAEFGAMLPSIEQYNDNYKQSIDQKDSIVEERIFIENSGYFEIRTFRIIDGKWMLISFDLHNL